MELFLKKQPRKYLASVDDAVRKKLNNALDDIAELRGDIVCINRKENLYRYKIAHYRVIFEYSGGDVITIVAVDTRTNTKYRRYR